MTAAPHVFWNDKAGNPLACREKHKVLDGNLREITAQCRDALDDAVLMGCSAEAFRAALRHMVEHLEPTVKERP